MKYIFFCRTAKTISRLPVWLDTVNVPSGGTVDMNFTDPVIQGQVAFSLPFAQSRRQRNDGEDSL
jgi:hypothetical protein